MSDRMLPPPLMFGQDWARMGLGMSAFMNVGHGEQQQQPQQQGWAMPQGRSERSPIEMAPSWVHERYGDQNAEEIRRSGSPWLGIGLAEIMKQTEKWIDHGKQAPDPKAPSFTLKDLERSNQQDAARREYESVGSDTPPPVLPMPDVQGERGGDNRELAGVLKDLKDVLKDLAEILRDKKADQQQPGVQADGSFVPMGQQSQQQQPAGQYQPASPAVPHTSRGISLPNAAAMMRSLFRGG